MKEGHPPAFWLIYVLSVIFTFHGLLVAYSSSTFMEQFASPQVVSSLYTIASAFGIIAFLCIPHILKQFGNFRVTLWLSAFEILTLVLLGFTLTPLITIIAFVFFLIINPIIYLNIDIFSESIIGTNEGSTGSKRGLALTLMSLAAVCAPLALSFIVGEDSSRLYLTYLVAAFIFCTFILLILIHFRTFTDPKYQKINVLQFIGCFWHSYDLRIVFIAHLLLQVYFTWVTIYLPLYMATEVGLSWEAIGSIIAVGLMAYVLVEYPAGILADKYFGEQEMMAIGFVILAISSSWIIFMENAPILSWMILMFVGRVGASLVEVTTESYFFKKTGGGDTNTISFFRLTRPLSVLIGTLAGTIMLFVLPFKLAFVMLGIFMLPGILLASRIRDTK